ncbi:hypothetical protein S40285_10715 [Stachybotrys chlorohalonatus IBT 40285]|uniref:Uncharacterized protein n=1 Tax=Stachybotrys chlorohalonatus (strain IBT 40285) TaxID=1283841 RepID=A0A084Q7X8_STAC4|nr:hypothetical protein S40285_10715 [Stachybotrys chlorohalonata IBT 40285]
MGGETPWNVLDNMGNQSISLSSSSRLTGDNNEMQETNDGVVTDSTDHFQQHLEDALYEVDNKSTADSELDPWTLPETCHDSSFERSISHSPAVSRTDKQSAAVSGQNMSKNSAPDLTATLELPATQVSLFNPIETVPGEDVAIRPTDLSRTYNQCIIPSCEVDDIPAVRIDIFPCTAVRKRSAPFGDSQKSELPPQSPKKLRTWVRFRIGQRIFAARPSAEPLLKEADAPATESPLSTAPESSDKPEEDWEGWKEGWNNDLTFKLPASLTQKNEEERGKKAIPWDRQWKREVLVEPGKWLYLSCIPLCTEISAIADPQELLDVVDTLKKENMWPLLLPVDGYPLRLRECVHCKLWTFCKLMKEQDANINLAEERAGSARSGRSISEEPGRRGREKAKAPANQRRKRIKMVKRRQRSRSESREAIRRSYSPVVVVFDKEPEVLRGPVGGAGGGLSSEDTKPGTSDQRTGGN